METRYVAVLGENYMVVGEGSTEREALEDAEREGRKIGEDHSDARAVAYDPAHHAPMLLGGIVCLVERGD